MQRACSHPQTWVVKRFPRFRQIFSLPTPVLLWDGLFTKELWDSLSQIRAPYGWQRLPHQAIASTLLLLNGSESAQRFAASEKPRRSCIRCAVVGNGGMLNGSRWGWLIDAHDYVFRVNGAVIKGFEADVVTKTSFYGFTVNTMKHSIVNDRNLGFTSVPQRRGLRYVFIPASIRAYVMLRSAILGVPVPKGRVLKSSLMNTEAKYIYMPSTGALLLLTALHTCDQVSAYGFITKKYWKFSDHYFEQEKKPLKFYTNHDLQLEAALWKDLHEAGIIQLYQH
uniref:alpha-N-acetylgalactosaminide alpha-2,6-sialyltransferase n=1 Tax=Equus caballus TaxID=9796 RepID=F6T7R6_HORSE